MQAESDPDACELGAHGGGLRAVAGVERAVQIADAVEHEPHRLRRVEIVVHRLAEGGLEGGEGAGQRAVGAIGARQPPAASSARASVS